MKINKKLATVLTVILCLFLLTVCTACQKDKKTLIDLGEKYLEELDYDKAILTFEQAIETEPRNEQGYIGLYNAYIAKGEDALAKEALETGYDNTGSEVIKALLDEIKEKEERAKALAANKANSPSENEQEQPEEVEPEPEETNEGKKIYKISLKSSNDNYGEVKGGGSYPDGDKIIIKATPKEGYQFVKWSDENETAERQIVVKSDKLYIAYFEEIPANTYYISVSSSDPVMGSVSGSGSYHDGEKIKISAKANDGYKFVKWSDGSTSATKNITVTKSEDYIAYFENKEPDKYTITVTSANANAGYVSGSGSYASGSTVTISASAYNGYKFTKWSDGNTSASRSITVTGNASYTAVFERWVAVTNCVGSNYSSAVATLEASGLSVSVSWSHSESTGWGKVMAQSPSSGYLGDNGSVSLTVSCGTSGKTVSSSEIGSYPSSQYDITEYTQYSYRTKSKEYNQSAYSSLSGWTRYDSSSSTSTGDWQTNNPGSGTSYSGVYEIVTSVKKGYHYYAYAASYKGDSRYYLDRSEAEVRSHMDANFNNWGGVVNYYDDISETDRGGYWNGYWGDDEFLYYDSPRYKVTTTKTTYYYYRISDWSSWSSWSNTDNTPSGYYDTETRTQKIYYVVGRAG